jgi:hypothetical protein
VHSLGCRGGGSVCPAGPRLRSHLAQTLDDGGVGHPAALAHRLQCALRGRQPAWLPRAGSKRTVCRCHRNAPNGTNARFTIGAGKRAFRQPCQRPPTPANVQIDALKIRTVESCRVRPEAPETAGGGQLAGTGSVVRIVSVAGQPIDDGESSGNQPAAVRLRRERTCSPQVGLDRARASSPVTSIAAPAVAETISLMPGTHRAVVSGAGEPGNAPARRRA